MKASRTTPALAREFAKAKGLLAKTVSIDARLLTDYGIQFTPRVTVALDPVLEEIQAIIKYRRHLNEQLLREKQQLEITPPKSVQAYVGKRIKQLNSQIKDIDNLLLSLKDRSPCLSEALDLPATTEGLGVNSALSLSAPMPGLGKISNKQAASLAGLAPFKRDSGQFKGQRKIHGGRREIRKAIYMAALAGSKHNEILSGFHKCLLEKGKPRKLALIAVMRKLLSHLNSLMKSHLESITQTTS